MSFRLAFWIWFLLSLEWDVLQPIIAGPMTQDVQAYIVRYQMPLSVALSTVAGIVCVDINNTKAQASMRPIDTSATRLENRCTQIRHFIYNDLTSNRRWVNNDSQECKSWAQIAASPICKNEQTTVSYFHNLSQSHDFGNLRPTGNSYWCCI